MRNVFLLAIAAIASFCAQPGHACTFGVFGDDCILDKYAKLLDEINSSFRGATDALDRNSGQWQATLKNLSADLVDKGAPELAKQVDQLTAEIVSNTGAEFKCDVDFVADRTGEALEYLRISFLRSMKLTQEDFPVYPPAFCHAIPSYVETTLVKMDQAAPSDARSSLIYLDGYNVSSYRGNLSAYLLDDAAGLIDVTDTLGQPTKYRMTLNTQRINAQSCGAKSISLRWRGREIYSLPVVHASGTKADCIVEANRIAANVTCTDKRVNYSDYGDCFRKEVDEKCAEANAKGNQAAIGHWCSGGGDGRAWGHTFCTDVPSAKTNWSNDSSPGRAACLAGRAAMLADSIAKCPTVWICSDSMRRLPALPAIADPTNESDHLDDYIHARSGPAPKGFVGSYPGGVCKKGSIRLRFVSFLTAITQDPLRKTDDDLQREASNACLLQRIPPGVLFGADGTAKWTSAAGVGSTAHCLCQPE